MSVKTKAGQIVELHDFHALRAGNADDLAELRDQGSIDEHLVITLALRENVANAPFLVAGTEGRVIGRDNLGRIPAGNYIVHVYDTTIEARAVWKTLASSQSCSWDNLHESRASLESLPSGEGVIVFRTLGVVKPDLAFEGADGPVSFAIIDQRALPDEGLPIRLSLSWNVEDVLEFHRNGGLSKVSQHIRSKTIARLAEETALNSTGMMMLQHALEKVPGALLSIGCISVEHIYERIDEICDDEGIAIPYPSVSYLHERLHALRGSLSSSSPEELIDGMARACVSYAIRKGESIA